MNNTGNQKAENVTPTENVVEEDEEKEKFEYSVYN